MVKGKKGWVKMLEAVIAIAIITGAVMILLSRQSMTENSAGDRIYERQNQIMDLILKNESIRNDLVDGRKSTADELIRSSIPLSWNYTVEVCEIDRICSSDATPLNQEIYTAERIVTSTLTKYDAKKVKMFVWIK